MERQINNPDFNTTILKKSEKRKEFIGIKNLDEDIYIIKHFDPKWIHKLIDIRKRNELKQDEFASKLGLGISMYKQLEANKLVYDGKLVERINNKLNKLKLS